MNRRGQRTSLQERFEIMERAAAGHTDAASAALLGCSLWTVRKWRRLGKRDGAAGLASRLGRPSVGPLGTRPASVRATVRRLREAHPGWGPGTSLASLRTDPGWDSAALLGRTQIAAY